MWSFAEGLVSSAPRPGRMESFVPIDRRLSDDPRFAPRDPNDGVVLMADLSGFTAAGEALSATLGPRRGAEALARLLDRVHGALLGPVEAMRGVAVTFIGDAVLCWFCALEGEPASEVALRALAAACAMPGRLAEVSADPSIGDLGPLQMRGYLAAGRARRFLLGAPSTHRLDVLAGAPVRTLAAMSGSARRGEILADHRVLELVGAAATCGRRVETSTGGTAAVVARCHRPRPVTPWPTVIARSASDPAEGWLPRSVFARLARGEGEYFGDLRLVATAFFDVVGIDDLQADAGERLDAWLCAVAPQIARLGGTIVDLTASEKGLNLYAAFGAPDAIDDASQQAVLAALQLVNSEGIGGVRAQRAGLGYGELRSGVIGSPFRRAWTITGSETNLAARLMERAPRDTVLVSERLAASVGASPPFTLSPRAPVSLKGLARPVVAFEARPVTRVRRSSIAPVSQALVGREVESATLDGALLAAAGQIAPIVMRIEGEAGVGKSVLAGALMERARARGFNVLHGVADRLDRGTPLRVWRQLFPDPTLVARALTADDADLLPLLHGILVEVPDETPRTRALVEHARAEATLSLLSRLLERDPDRRPRLLVLDDAHWLDSASWSVLAIIAARAHRILLVLCHRPWEQGQEYFARLSDEPQTRHIGLGGVGRDALTLIATSTARADRVSDDVLDALTTRTGGHPLFATVLLRSLLEDGSIRVDDGELRRAEGILSWEDRTLPESVEEAIATRIDRLPEGARFTLKVASVLGREFGLDALTAVHPLRSDSDRLGEQLDSLVRAGFVGTASQRITFVHALIQEVAYQRLETAQRMVLHRAAAQHLEATTDATSAALAFHWRRAGENVRARVHLDAAGADALRRGAFREAAEYLAMARDLEDSPGGARACSRVVMLGRALFRAGRLRDAMGCAEWSLSRLDRPMPVGAGLVFRSVAEVGRQAFSRWKPARVDSSARERERLDAAAEQYAHFAELCFFARRFDGFLYATLRNINVAERAGPGGPLVVANGNVAIATGMLGLVRVAREYLRLAEDASARASVDDYHRAMFIHQRNLFRLGVGELASAVADQVEAVALFERCGDRGRVRDAWVIQASALVLVGASAQASQVLRLLTRPDVGEERFAQQSFGWMYLAGVACRADRAEDAALALRALQFAQRSTGIDSTLVAADGLAAYVAARLGDPAEGCARLAAALGHIQQTGGVPMGVPDLEGYVGVASASRILWERAIARRDPGAVRRAAEDAARIDRLLHICTWFLPVAEPLWRLHRSWGARLRGDAAGARREAALSAVAARRFGTGWERRQADEIQVEARSIAREATQEQ